MNKRKVHFYSLRHYNNAGMNFPRCCANARMLDIDKSRWPTTGDPGKVTCKNCLRVINAVRA
jgi:hypothetical protein